MMRTPSARNNARLADIIVDPASILPTEHDTDAAFLLGAANIVDRVDLHDQIVVL